MGIEFTVRDIGAIASFEDMFKVLTDKEIEPPPDLTKAVLFELLKCMEVAQRYQESNPKSRPRIQFSNGKADDISRQVIWYFSVTNPKLPLEDKYNYHGQNISQVIYSGAVVLTLNMPYGELPLPSVCNADMFTSEVQCQIFQAYDKATGRLLHQYVQRTSEPVWRDFTSNEVVAKPEQVTPVRPETLMPAIGTVSRHH